MPESIALLRTFLEERLGKQDAKLDEMGHQIQEIDKNTNGRLRDLETERKVLLAVDDRRKEWELTLAQKAQDRSEQHWKVAYGGLMIVGGGVAGGIGHALGWW